MADNTAMSAAERKRREEIRRLKKVFREEQEAERVIDETTGVDLCDEEQSEDDEEDEEELAEMDREAELQLEKDTKKARRMERDVEIYRFTKLRDQEAAAVAGGTRVTLSMPMDLQRAVIATACRGPKDKVIKALRSLIDMVDSDIMGHSAVPSDLLTTSEQVDVGGVPNAVLRSLPRKYHRVVQNYTKPDARIPRTTEEVLFEDVEYAPMPSDKELAGFDRRLRSEMVTVEELERMSTILHADDEEEYADDDDDDDEDEYGDEEEDDDEDGDDDEDDEDDDDEDEDDEDDDDEDEDGRDAAVASGAGRGSGSRPQTVSRKRPVSNLTLEEPSDKKARVSAEPVIGQTAASKAGGEAPPPEFVAAFVGAFAKVSQAEGICSMYLCKALVTLGAKYQQADAKFTEMFKFSRASSAGLLTKVATRNRDENSSWVGSCQRVKELVRSTLVRFGAAFTDGSGKPAWVDSMHRIVDLMGEVTVEDMMEEGTGALAGTRRFTYYGAGDGETHHDLYVPSSWCKFVSAWFHFAACRSAAIGDVDAVVGDSAVVPTTAVVTAAFAGIHAHPAVVRRLQTLTEAEEVIKEVLRHDQLPLLGAAPAPSRPASATEFDISGSDDMLGDVDV